MKKLAGVGYLPRVAGESDAAYRDRVLAGRIVEVLRDRQLRKTGGIEPKREEVDARVALLESRVVKERGETLDAILARAGATREDLYAFVKRGMTLESFVRERLSPGIKTTDAELRAYYEGPFREEARARGVASVPPYEEISRADPRGRARAQAQRRDRALDGAAARRDARPHLPALTGEAPGASDMR